MLAVTAAYMLVQLSSLPVALSLPALAKYFDTSIDDAAWVPSTIDLLLDESAQIFFVRAFQSANLVVVITLLSSATLAYFHKAAPLRVIASDASTEPTPQTAGND